jgi:hypothetical protein
MFYESHIYTNIQFIVLDNCNIAQYIYNNYDYDIVRNIFYYKNNKPILKLSNINDIFTQTTGIKTFGDYCNNNFKRENSIYHILHKYIKYKNIKFNITRSINSIYQYYNRCYQITYFTNVYNNEIDKINNYAPIIHQPVKHEYYKLLILYKLPCPINCILQLINCKHYHIHNNNGRLLYVDENINSMYINGINIIHIDEKYI